MCEISSKLIIKTPEQCHRSEVPIANLVTGWVNIGWFPLTVLKNKEYDQLLYKLFPIKLAFNPSLTTYSNSIVNDL